MQLINTGILKTDTKMIFPPSFSFVMGLCICVCVCVLDEYKNIFGSN